MGRLVGVDDWSDWPPAVQQLPRVGPDLTIDLDRVEALKPDLVLASLSVPGMERNVEGLVARGLPHMVLDPGSLAEIWANLRPAVHPGVGGLFAICESPESKEDKIMRWRIQDRQAYSG